MLWLLNIILIFVLLLLWLLSAPLILTIDSDKNVYQLVWKSIGKAEFILLEDRYLIQFRIWTFKRNFDIIKVLAKQGSVRNRSQKKTSQKSKNKGTRQKNWRTIRSILNSFEINLLELGVYLDDFVFASIIFPFVYLLNARGNKGNRNIYLSFHRSSHIHLIIKNRLGRMLWAYFSPNILSSPK